MSEISTFLGITIYMYFDGQNTPHFQVLYNGRHGMFSLLPLNYFSGNLPPRVVGLVLDWAVPHKGELIDNWERIKETGKCQKIPSLVSG